MKALRLVPGDQLVDPVRLNAEADTPVFMAERVRVFCEDQGLEQTVITSPLFLDSGSLYDQHLERRKRPYMARFYKLQRERLRTRGLLRCGRRPVLAIRQPSP